MQKLGPFVAFLPSLTEPSQKQLHWCYIVIDEMKLWSIQTAPIVDNEELPEIDSAQFTIRQSNLVQKIPIMQTFNEPNNNFCFVAYIFQDGEKKLKLLETFSLAQRPIRNSKSGVHFDSQDFIFPSTIEQKRSDIVEKYERWRARQEELLSEDARNIYLKLRDPAVNVVMTPARVSALLSRQNLTEYLIFAQIYYAGDEESLDHELTLLVKKLIFQPLIADVNEAHMGTLWDKVEVHEDFEIIACELGTTSRQTQFYQSIPDDKLRLLVCNAPLQDQLQDVIYYAKLCGLAKNRFETLMATFTDEEIKGWINKEKDFDSLLLLLADGAQKNRYLALAVPKLNMDVPQLLIFCNKNKLTLIQIEALKQLRVRKETSQVALELALLAHSPDLLKNIATITSVKELLDERISSLSALTQLLGCCNDLLKATLLHVVGVDKIKTWVVDGNAWASLESVLPLTLIEQYFKDVSFGVNMRAEENEQLESSEEPLKKSKAKSYQQYDFTQDKTYTKSGLKSIDLYPELLKKYDKTLSQLKQKCAGTKTTAQYQYLVIAEEILKHVKTLAATSRDHEAVYVQLNQVLYRCNLALEKPMNMNNIHQLPLLAKKLPGNPSQLSQALSVLLYSFAVLILLAGVLAFIPTQSGNVLLNVLVGVKLHSVATALASTATSVAAAMGSGITANAVSGTIGVGFGTAIGLGGLYAGLFKQKGLAKSVTELGQKIEADKLSRH